MSSTHPARKSYEESCRHLQRIAKLAEGPIPALPDRRPAFDDEDERGVRFFRTWVGSGDPFGLQASSPEHEGGGIAEYALENLTLPRTYFGRSEISRISFKNTDLSESTLCWNDFIEVNFTDADLSDCDLRASLFTRTLFVRATLRNADLRHSNFKDCDFSCADLRGVKLTRDQGKKLNLTEEQKQVIDWQDSPGEEPPGG